jgi:hypothetical protein
VGAPDATEIWISLLSGEAPVKLWEDPERRWQKGATWSPDGNWIAFYSTYQGKPSVMKVRVGSGQPPELVTSTSEPQPVRWSPKGDWIAVHDLQTLRLVSPDGKQEKVVSQKKWETYGWSADGESLLGIAIHDRHLTLARIEVKTGAETHVADLGPVTASMEFANFVGEFAFRGFAMHPNGKSFLTSVYRARTQIYLMRNWEGLWRR